ncbi:MAG: type II secretion system protein GspI [Gammaproteobacteria bacterium]|nr:MAG: type II secretion system protein GspI [Gammaproteobacteria bacterium]
MSMARLPVKRCTSGLTLIEVLIALAIVGIAMTAIIKAASQSIRGTTYLQDKTIAMWVGSQVLNEARVGILVLPKGETLKQTTRMLNRDWHWQAQQEETADERIKKIQVDVYGEEEEDQNETPIVSLESYINAKE